MIKVCKQRPFCAYFRGDVANMMDVRKFITKKLIILGIGECVLIAFMSLVFVALEKFDVTIVIGGIASSILALANFFFLAIAADSAADSAVAQDVKAGKNKIHNSYMTRTVVIFVILLILAKTGWANPIALVAPFFVVRPLITVDEFFSKPKEQKE